MELGVKGVNVRHEGLPLATTDVCGESRGFVAMKLDFVHYRYEI